MRKILDPNRKSSYSQTGEDHIIDYYLDTDNASSVFYVDIGCNRPFAASNTALLYRKGARGVAIDANSKIIQEYSRIRPRDISVCACISDCPGQMTFVVAKRDKMSTISESFEKERLFESDILERRKVDVVTANTVFKKYNVPSSFDLLSVDVEGHDLEVLKSIDFSLYKPKMIVVEMHQAAKDCANIEKDDIYMYLSDQNYKLVAFSTMNGYFLRK